ncbi:DUF4097 family beta strand repeat-containing protein [Bacteroidota bacterium]
MKLIIRFCITLLIVGNVFGANEKKKFERSFKVEPNQRIEIINLPAMNVRVKTWDKNEVKFDLLVSINSSDEDYEEKFIKYFDIVETRTSSDLVLEFDQPEDGGWSFWDIFELKFHYYVEKQIRGEIYIPTGNALYAEFKYSDIDLRGMKGDLELDGRSNDLVLTECMNIRTINNIYGNVTITKSSGNLLLEFDGPVTIDAPYSNVELYDISQSADVSTRSASVKAEKINGDLTLDAPYCDVEIDDVKGTVKASDRSGKLKVNNVLGIALDIPYSNLMLSEVTSGDKPLLISSRSEKLFFENIVADLNIDDSYSNFEIKNHKGDINLSSRSGEIVVYGLEGNWESETQYSTYRFVNMKSDRIKIDNRSNPITIDLLNVPRSIEIKNPYGNVDISIPKGFGGEVELVAQYGEIACDLPLKFKSEGSTSTAYGRVGSGSGKIKIEVRSANITINEK